MNMGILSGVLKIRKCSQFRILFSIYCCNGRLNCVKQYWCQLVQLWNSTPIEFTPVTWYVCSIGVQGDTMCLQIKYQKCYRQDHWRQPQVHQVRWCSHYHPGSFQAHVRREFPGVPSSRAICCARHETNRRSRCDQGKFSILPLKVLAVFFVFFNWYWF